ncbi:MAG: nitrophenyl compound nitroreductase subunit ArsF family protein [Acetobacter sp.]|nr:nitrophenyl compound nitroreductase subunit ArsF family protein [Acetobacter sp.]
MKKIVFLSLGMCLLSFVVQAEVVVSYYHNSVRCSTCRKMETWSSEAVKDLEVRFESVNTDEPENKHFLSDYGLYTKSVVVQDTDTGKWKNLDKLWNNIGNEQAFKDYVRQEVQDFIEASK